MLHLTNKESKSERKPHRTQALSYLVSRNVFFQTINQVNFNFLATAKTAEWSPRFSSVRSNYGAMQQCVTFTDPGPARELLTSVNVKDTQRAKLKEKESNRK